MHKKSFLIRDILSKLNAESTANSGTSMPFDVSSSPTSERDQNTGCPLNAPLLPKTTSCLATRLTSFTSSHTDVQSTIDSSEVVSLMSSFAHSPSISFSSPSTSSALSVTPFVFTPNVNPFSYPWSLAAVAMATNSSKSKSVFFRQHAMTKNF